MKKNFWIVVLKNIITILQVLMLVPPLLLQYLSDRKMGVMRYLVFKKDVFAKEIFTLSFTFTYRNLLFLGIIFCMIFLISSYNKRINRSFKEPIITLFLCNSICLFYASYYKFQILMAYHFFLIAFLIIIILQYVKIVIAALIYSSTKKSFYH